MSRTNAKSGSPVLCLLDECSFLTRPPLAQGVVPLVGEAVTAAGGFEIPARGAPGVPVSSGTADAPASVLPHSLRTLIVVSCIDCNLKDFVFAPGFVISQFSCRKEQNSSETRAPAGSSVGSNS